MPIRDQLQPSGAMAELFLNCRPALLLALLLFGASALAESKHASPVRSRAAPVDYNRDIRPIFSENCYACHGPDQNKRKAGLRLDQKEEAFKELKSGNFAIVAGDLSRSKLIER